VLVDGRVVSEKRKVGLVRKILGFKGFPADASAVTAVKASL
jgi:hypothetical protein